MSELSSLPAEVRKQLARLQQLQQTLQNIASQKQELQRESTEANEALDELEKMSGEALSYKSMGAVLVKSDKQRMIEELTEKKEVLDMRIKVLVKQQNRTEKRLEELQQNVRHSLSIPQ